MPLQYFQGAQDIIEALHYRPAISILLPFEPKMSLTIEMKQHLRYAADKVKAELMKQYPDEICLLMSRKLRMIIQKLNFNTSKKSIAIFLSPVFEKVLYLDFPVDEKIIIDESYEIRDVVYAKKEFFEYLILLISGEQSKVFLGNPSGLKKIKSNTISHTNNITEPVANFSDPSYRKEVLLKKFLHLTDIEFSQLLQAYPLPVFVMGAKKTTGYFKDITKNQKSIIRYIHGNFMLSTEAELKNIIQEYITDWKKIKEGNLLHKLELAAGKGKLAVGMKEVWKLASHHRGRLLVVENDFRHPAEFESNTDIIDKP